MCLYVCICVCVYIYVDMYTYVHAYSYKAVILSRTHSLSLFPHFLPLYSSHSLSHSFSVSLCLSLLTPHRPHITKRHQHAVQKTHMRLVRTIIGPPCIPLTLFHVLFLFDSGALSYPSHACTSKIDIHTGYKQLACALCA